MNDHDKKKMCKVRFTKDDIMYHVKRIYFNGLNTPNLPWNVRIMEILFG